MESLLAFVDEHVSPEFPNNMTRWNMVANEAVPLWGTFRVSDFGSGVDGLVICLYYRRGAWR